MGEHTGIAWCDHTFNPVWGCTRVSAGCVNCYAETWAKRSGVGWGPRSPRRTFGDKHWGEPLKWNQRAEKLGVRYRVFSGSMCDIFEDHPTVEAQLPRLFALIAATPRLDWLLLTKRPERARDFLGSFTLHNLVEAGEDLAARMGWRHAGEDGWSLPLANVWLGTSCEDQATADQRIPILFQCPAVVRFVSYEPALGPVDFERSIPCGYYCDESVGHVDHGPNGRLGFIDWLIVGGESGPGARPFDLAWARSARDQCREAGVAFFMKQLGSQVTAPHSNGVNVTTLRLKDRKGDHPENWPHSLDDLKIREFPSRRGALNA